MGRDSWNLGATGANKEFYKKIKKACPETIFYGTDVGHKYDTLGEQYLIISENTGKKTQITINGHRKL